MAERAEVDFSAMASQVERLSDALARVDERLAKVGSTASKVSARAQADEAKLRAATTKRVSDARTAAYAAATYARAERARLREEEAATRLKQYSSLTTRIRTRGNVQAGVVRQIGDARAESVTQLAGAKLTAQQQKAAADAQAIIEKGVARAQAVQMVAAARAASKQLIADAKANAGPGAGGAIGPETGIIKAMKDLAFASGAYQQDPSPENAAILSDVLTKFRSLQTQRSRARMTGIYRPDPSELDIPNLGAATAHRIARRNLARARASGDLMPDEMEDLVRKEKVARDRLQRARNPVTGAASRFTSALKRVQELKADPSSTQDEIIDAEANLEAARAARDRALIATGRMRKPVKTRPTTPGIYTRLKGAEDALTAARAAGADALHIRDLTHKRDVLMKQVSAHMRGEGNAMSPFAQAAGSAAHYFLANRLSSKIGFPAAWAAGKAVRGPVSGMVSRMSGVFGTGMMPPMRAIPGLLARASPFLAAAAAAYGGYKIHKGGGDYLAELKRQTYPEGGTIGGGAGVRAYGVRAGDIGGMAASLRSAIISDPLAMVASQRLGIPGGAMVDPRYGGLTDNVAILQKAIEGLAKITDGEERLTEARRLGLEAITPMLAGSQINRDRLVSDAANAAGITRPGAMQNLSAADARLGASWQNLQGAGRAATERFWEPVIQGRANIENWLADLMQGQIKILNAIAPEEKTADERLEEAAKKLSKAAGALQDATVPLRPGAYGGGPRGQAAAEWLSSVQNRETRAWFVRTGAGLGYL